MLDDCIDSWDEDMVHPGLAAPDSSSPTTSTFHLLFETNTTADTHHLRHSSPTLLPSLLSHHVSAHLNNPPLLFVQPSATPCDEAEAVKADAEEVECEAGRKWWLGFGERSSRAVRMCAVRERGRVRVQAGELQRQVSLLSGHVPCDTDVLSISVHRPVERTEVREDVLVSCISVWLGTSSGGCKLVYETGWCRLQCKLSGHLPCDKDVLSISVHWPVEKTEVREDVFVSCINGGGVRLFMKLGGTGCDVSYWAACFETCTCLHWLVVLAPQCFLPALSALTTSLGRHLIVLYTSFYVLSLPVSSQRCIDV